MIATALWRPSRPRSPLRGQALNAHALYALRHAASGRVRRRSGEPLPALAVGAAGPGGPRPEPPPISASRWSAVGCCRHRRGPAAQLTYQNPDAQRITLYIRSGWRARAGRGPGRYHQLRRRRRREYRLLGRWGRSPTLCSAPSIASSCSRSPRSFSSSAPCRSPPGGRADRDHREGCHLRARAHPAERNAGIAGRTREARPPSHLPRSEKRVSQHEERRLKPFPRRISSLSVPAAVRLSTLTVARIDNLCR